MNMPSFLLGARLTVPGTLAGARVFTAVYATTSGVRLVGCTLSVPGVVFLCLFWVLCSCSLSSLYALEAAPLLVLALKPGLAAGGAYAPLCFT